MRPVSWIAPALCALVIPLGGCGGDSLDAEPVGAPVIARALAGPTTTDLGYTITPVAVRQLLVDLEFTQGGEAHAGILRRALALVIGRAHAHPGHASGGAVRGELPGRYVVDWMRGGALGEARVLPGSLDGVDFGLGTADAADGLAADDPLIGANLFVEAAVERDGRAWTLAVAVPQDDGRRIYGAPCAVEAAEGAPLPIALDLTDPYEGDSAFDGLDFEALDPDGDGHIDPTAELVNRLKRAFQTHDHYGLGPEETP